MGRIFKYSNVMMRVAKGLTPFTRWWPGLVAGASLALMWTWFRRCCRLRHVLFSIGGEISRTGRGTVVEHGFEVAAQFVVDATVDGCKLASLLMSALPRDFPSRASAQRALKRGSILIDGKQPSEARKLVSGQTIQYVCSRQRAHLAGASAVPPELQLECLHADEWLAALVKPSGVSVQVHTAHNGRRLAR
jgi:hypothetical protein